MNTSHIHNKEQLNSLFIWLGKQIDDGGTLNIAVTKVKKQRTLTQNKALHKYCELLAEALNDAGYDFRTFIKEGISVPFTKDLVKEHLWRPVQKVVLDENSTTKPDTSGYSKVYDVLNMHLITNKNIFVPWPDKNSI